MTSGRRPSCSSFFAMSAESPQKNSALEIPFRRAFSSASRTADDSISAPMTRFAREAMKKIFGDYSSRELKSIYPLADKIEALGDSYKAMSDEQLRGKTQEFKDRLANGETLDDILPEAFATVREASDRVLGLRPYRVQLLGGIVLHQGRIAEMKTGEGKTLVATLPSYLNALTGRGVHIVTVNDYLAKRDSEWMGKIHRFLGLNVGLIVHGLTTKERQEAYAADITYGTNNEMGFDYLRDNMCIYASELVQRGHAQHLQLSEKTGSHSSGVLQAGLRPDAERGHRQPDAYGGQFLLRHRGLHNPSCKMKRGCSKTGNATASECWRHFLFFIHPAAKKKEPLRLLSQSLRLLFFTLFCYTALFDSIYLSQVTEVISHLSNSIYSLFRM